MKTYKRMIRGREVECRYSPRDSRAQHVDEVRLMVEKGFRYAEIADTLDIAYEAVRVIVYTYNIPYPYKAGRPKETKKMKKFTVNANAQVNFSITLLAEDEESARMLAMDMEPSLCISCSGANTSDYEPSEDVDDSPWSVYYDPFEVESVEEEL